VTEGTPQSTIGQNSSMQQEKDIPLARGDIPAIMEAVAKSMQRSPVPEKESQTQDPKDILPG